MKTAASKCLTAAPASSSGTGPSIPPTDVPRPCSGRAELVETRHTTCDLAGHATHACPELRRPAHPYSTGDIGVSSRRRSHVATGGHASPDRRGPGGPAGAGGGLERREQVLEQREGAPAWV